MHLPPVQQRTPRPTPQHIDREIHERTQRRIGYFGRHPEKINERLRELDKEWDVERALQTNASALVVAGSTLGLMRHKGFFAVPIIAGGFFLQHALRGTCPPFTLLRRLGVRTAAEIEQERSALKGICQNRY